MAFFKRHLGPPSPQCTETTMYPETENRFFFQVEVCTLKGAHWLYMICGSVLDKKKLCPQFLYIFAQFSWVFDGVPVWNVQIRETHEIYAKSMILAYWVSNLSPSPPNQPWRVRPEIIKKKKIWKKISNLKENSFFAMKNGFGLGAVFRVEKKFFVFISHLICAKNMMFSKISAWKFTHFLDVKSFWL